MTDYHYNSLGELERIDPPTAQEDTLFTYDSLSRLETVTDGEGQTTTYSYDPLDRVTLVDPHAGASITYDYDSDGNMTARSDVTGSTTMAYNDKNELEEREDGAGVEASFSYDPVGNLETLEDPGGLITYTYDNVNLLRTITEPGNHDTTFEYNDNRNPYKRTDIDFPNGATEDLSYDFSGRTSTIQTRAEGAANPFFNKSYDYSNGTDDTGLIQGIDDLSSAPQNVVYTYDTFNRLETANGATDYSYTYDNNGNIRSKTIGSTTTNLTYNNANELLEMGSVDYDYDDNGNLVSSSGGLSLDYNSLNQTTSMNGTSMDYADVTQDERTSSGSEK